MDQIGLFFKCQSCSDYVLSNNIQCPNGHQVCQACFENLSYCPTCHQRVAPSTRIPFLLTTNVDPILNVGESFDLLLPSLLRIAPAIHPCSPDEMIITDNPSSLILNSSSSVNINNNDSSMQKNNNLADQLLIANSCEVEETLSRLMMLASMSPGPTHSTSGADNDTNVQQPPPPGLMNSSKPFPTSAAAAAAAAAAASVEPGDWLSSSASTTTGATTTPTNSQQAPQKQQVDEYPEF